MDLDELNQRVTTAILRAEGLAEGSREAWAAFREVATLEERIAKATAAGDLEGEIARVGAVTAALRAGEPLRAVRLAQRYLDEGVDAVIAARLEGLMKEAHTALAGGLANMPTIKPVTFSLRAA